MKQHVGGLGTHISPKNSKKAVLSGVDNVRSEPSPFQTGYTDDAYNPNGYPYDEYKQAPAAGDHGDDHNSYRYDEYGDDKKVKDKESNSNEIMMDRHPWSCPSCSFLNDVGNVACELCSSVKPIDESDEPQDESQELDFDFNVEDIMNDVVGTSGGSAHSSGSAMVFGSIEGSKAVPDVNRFVEEQVDPAGRLDDGLSFNSLFFGDYSEENELPELTISSFAIGERVRYESDSHPVPIHGVVVEIRDSSKSLYPIRIEYVEKNGFSENVQKFMWVLPSELTKAGNPGQRNDGYMNDMLRYNDAEYDYSD